MYYNMNCQHTEPQNKDTYMSATIKLIKYK